MGEQCWGCGRIARVTRSSPTPFQVCTLCREEGCLPCAFCSTDCLRDAWPRHREWHREQKRLCSLAEEFAASHWNAAAAGTPTRSPYDELLASTMNLGLGAAATTNAVPPRAEQTSDLVHAVQHYVLSVERMSQAGARSLCWAERVVAAYALLVNGELAEVPRPSWWNDAALKDLSLQVLQARPDYVLAWRMRGEVLCALLGGANWVASRRSALELTEAGRSLQRATTLGQHELAPADKEKVVRQAVACFRAAQAAAEVERLDSRVSSGTATPTGGGMNSFGLASDWSSKQDRELDAWVQRVNNAGWTQE